jgi:hypothetical protein
MANFVHFFKSYLHEHWNVSTLQNKYSQLIFFWNTNFKVGACDFWGGIIYGT